MDVDDRVAPIDGGLDAVNAANAYDGVSAAIVGGGLDGAAADCGIHAMDVDEGAHATDVDAVNAGYAEPISESTTKKVC